MAVDDYRCLELSGGIVNCYNTGGASSNKEVGCSISLNEYDWSPGRKNYAAQNINSAKDEKQLQ